MLIIKSSNLHNICVERAHSQIHCGRSVGQRDVDVGREDGQVDTFDRQTHSHFETVAVGTDGQPLAAVTGGDRVNIRENMHDRRYSSSSHGHPGAEELPFLRANRDQIGPEPRTPFFMV